MSDRQVTTPGADRFLLGIAAGAVLLMVAATAAVFLVARASPPPSPDPGSPVGVVRAYVEALRAGRIEEAHGYLSRSARASVPLETYRQRYPRYVEPSGADPRVLIEPLAVGSETAEVKVTISRFAARSEPFSASTWHRDVTVRLVKENEAWRISQPVEPQPFWY